MLYYNENEIVQVVANALSDFYCKLLSKLEEIDMKYILERKNPYLFRARAYDNANDLITAILNAIISSSEETHFGSVFVEPIAIAASGGHKSISKGIDIEINNREPNTVYGIAVKSGPAVFNSNSKPTQEKHFDVADTLAKQAHLLFVPIIGYSYGMKSQTSRSKPKKYREIAGQRFWYEMTGDPDFYMKILDYMGDLPERYAEQLYQSYWRAHNRLTRDFLNNFCRIDGSIDWQKFLYASSADKSMN